MKILHTSDWHIGKKLYSKDMEQDHEHFFKWMIEYIIRENIDVLLVSGDIFDVAYPSNNALQLYYKVLKMLVSSPCRNVVIIGGNHDAVSTINAPKQILQFLDIHVIGGVSDNLSDELIEIKDERGQTSLLICAVPFLRDKDIRSSVSGESYDERMQSIRNGIAAHFNEIGLLSKPYKEQGIPVVAMAHLLASGAEFSDSERDIYIGNLGSVGADVFSNWFDYVALGHIHRPQKVAGLDHVRYSGSPIALSFSENKDIKTVIQIDLNSGSLSTIESVEVPQFRRLQKIEGNFESVQSTLSESDIPDNNLVWVDLLIREKHFVPGLIQEIESFTSRLNHIQVVNYKIMFTDKEKRIAIDRVEKSGVKEMKVTDVFDNLLEQLELTDNQELRSSFLELVDILSHKEQADKQ